MSQGSTALHHVQYRMHGIYIINARGGACLGNSQAALGQGTPASNSRTDPPPPPYMKLPSACFAPIRRLRHSCAAVCLLRALRIHPSALASTPLLLLCGGPLLPLLLLMLRGLGLAAGRIKPEDAASERCKLLRPLQLPVCCIHFHRLRAFCVSSPILKILR